MITAISCVSEASNQFRSGLSVESHTHCAFQYSPKYQPLGFRRGSSSMTIETELYDTKRSEGYANETATEKYEDANLLLSGHLKVPCQTYWEEHDYQD